jgi:hypothetical protein
MREAGADLPRVAQPAVIVIAEQQRAQVGAAAARRCEAADHELLLGRALELQPITRAAALVRALGTLRDDAFPALAARVVIQRLAVAVAVVCQAYRVAEDEGTA